MTPKFILSPGQRVAMELAAVVAVGLPVAGVSFKGSNTLAAAGALYLLWDAYQSYQGFSALKQVAPQTIAAA